MVKTQFPVTIPVWWSLIRAAEIHSEKVYDLLIVRQLTLNIKEKLRGNAAFWICFFQELTITTV